MTISGNNAANVAVGKPKATGAIFVAPKGTTLPTDASTALDVAYKCLGYNGEDGLTEKTETDVEEIKAWVGDVIARPQTSYSKSYEFVCNEVNAEVLKLAYGADNVTVSEGGAITVNHRGGGRTESVVVFEIALSNTKIQRTVVPVASVLEVGDVTYADGEAVGRSIVLGAMPDASGVSAYDYFAEVV